METWMQKAQRYRERAEEIRTMAETMHVPSTREAFKRLAQDYESIAEQACHNAKIEREGEAPQKR
jgi:hypothetical protein